MQKGQIVHWCYGKLIFTGRIKATPSWLTGTIYYNLTFFQSSTPRFIADLKDIVYVFFCVMDNKTYGFVMISVGIEVD